MNEIILREANLPDTMDDLAKFVLLGREQFIAIRAEIRAIEKLKLAEEVLNQKKQESLMISEIILDAEVRLGELFIEIPIVPGRRNDLEPLPTGGQRLNKNKKEIISELGFSQTTSQRLEILANNPDIVEYVKEEARENGEYPSRMRVLELVASKNKQKTETAAIPGQNAEPETDTEDTETPENISEDEIERLKEIEEYDKYVDLRVKIYKDLGKIIELINDFEITQDRMDALRDNFDDVIRIDEEIGYINDSIAKLNLIKSEIWKGKRNGKR